jgi:hypothetical protein
LRVRLEELAKRFKAWLLRPWSAVRIGKSAGLVVAFAAVLWGLAQFGRWAWMRWQGWRRPQEFDPVRRMAGQWLARLRQPSEVRGPSFATALDGRRQTEDGEVIHDLRRLRYGRRETWPEPHSVFKRAKRARRAVRR